MTNYIGTPHELIGSSLSVFDWEIKEILGYFPQTELLVFPELHLFGDGTPDSAREEALRASAKPLDGERGEGLKQLAKDNQIWLAPGSVCEAGDNGEIFNTQIVLSPNGELVGSYPRCSRGGQQSCTTQAINLTLCIQVNLIWG